VFKNTLDKNLNSTETYPASCIHLLFLRNLIKSIGL
jgi:hypothetical protein